ncbi:MAG: hypothetical protein ABI867_03560 [Kofleriaceae bacterium]
MRRLFIFALACSASGCLLYFDDHGKSCLATGDDVLEDVVAPVLLRNPESLTCDAFGGGGGCDPACGPCADGPIEGLTPPIPTWASCDSSCNTLDEPACGARSDCRVIKDANCAIGASTCFTDFMGCLPVSNIGDIGIDCATAPDGETCSHSSACTAFHVNEPCPLATDAQCPRPFALCMPEGQNPGSCFLPVTCDAATPTCAPGKTPGIAGGCFTGACIPIELCPDGPRPQQ